MFIVDAHLDIAYNALQFGRDPLLTVAQTRALESGAHPHGRGYCRFSPIKRGGRRSRLRHDICFA